MAAFLTAGTTATEGVVPTVLVNREGIMRLQWCALPVSLLLVLLPWFGLAGCGDESNGLAGTWVGYELLIDGEGDPDGGTNGIGGAVLVLNADGTGMSIDPELPDLPTAFTWSQNGDTFTMTAGSAPDDMTCQRQGDTLTLSGPMGSRTMSTSWRLHRGAQVLVGTWDLTSIVDDNGGVAPVPPPGQLSYVFSSTGRVAALVDDESYGNAEYSTDGPRLTIGPTGDPYMEAVFTVVGTTLYLFEYVPDETEDQLLVWRFERR